MTSKNPKIAVVRIRGKINKSEDIKETLKRLRLYKQNHCVILEQRSDLMGMVLKVKDFVTWGPVSEDIEQQLEKHYQEHDHRKQKPKPYFRLNPPKKGYGRKGIKKHFNIKGALGNRGEKMNDLLQRMMRK